MHWLLSDGRVQLSQLAAADASSSMMTAGIRAEEVDRKQSNEEGRPREEMCWPGRPLEGTVVANGSSFEITKKGEGSSLSA